MPVADRIKRAVYAFSIRRLFINIKRYVRKPAAITFGVLGEYASALFRAKVRKEEAAKKRVAELAMRAPGISWILIALIIAALILIPTLLIIALRYAFPPIVPPPPPAEVVPPPPHLIAKLRAAGAIDAGSPAGTRFWADIEWLTNESANVSVQLFALTRSAPREIFVLRTHYEFAENYKDWFAVLKDCVVQRGFSISEITPDDLTSLTAAGLRGVIIVPSGYAPSFLFDPNSSISARALAKTGSVVIYIGHGPTRVLLHGRAVELSSEFLAREFGIEVVPEATKPDRLNFSTTMYRITPARIREIIDPPTYFPRARAGENVFGWKDGAFVAIPVVLDTWWREAGPTAAHNVCAYATEARWGEHIAKGEFATVGSARRLIFTDRAPMLIERGYLRAIITAQLADVSGAVLDAVATRVAGSAEHIEETIASALTERITLRLTLRAAPGRKSIIWAAPISEKGEELKKIQLTRAPIPLDAPFTIPDFDATLPAGRYVLRIVDDEDNTLTASYLRIIPLEIRPETPDWLRGEFKFTIHEVGVEKPIERDLKGITITIDGEHATTTDAIKGSLLYSIPTAPTVGNHTFSFVLGADKIDLTLERTVPPFPFKTEHAILLAIALITFAIGALIARPEVVKYAIDVPDFPPVHAVAIPMSASTICKIFEDVNRELRWTATPLSLADLKRGFRRLSWKGRPISISDYNLERLLDQLREKGLVDKALDYWGLKEWERMTGKSMRTLALQRALRDFFVTEGIPFLPFGQRPDCDTVITFAGEKVILHVYEDDRVIGRAVATAAEARTVIVFEDFQTMRTFAQRLHAAADANIALKLLLEADQINLAPIEKLLDVLHKRFTFFYY